MASQFLNLAHEMDRLSVVRLGQARVSPELILRQILAEEQKRPSRFTVEFTQKVMAEVG
jgi:hypothetical protein